VFKVLVLALFAFRVASFSPKQRVIGYDEEKGRNQTSSRDTLISYLLRNTNTNAFEREVTKKFFTFFFSFEKLIKRLNLSLFKILKHCLNYFMSQLFII
jgi:hypothetical protein